MKRALVSSALILAVSLAPMGCPAPRDPHPERTPSPTPCNLGEGQCPMQTGRQSPEPMMTVIQP